MASRGRPKQYHEERVVTAVRLPKELVRDLKITALVKDLTMNDLLVRAATEYLDREGARVVERQEQVQ